MLLYSADREKGCARMVLMLDTCFALKLHTTIQQEYIQLMA